MRRPTSRMTPNRIQIRPVLFGKDAAALGRQALEGTARDLVPAAVQPTSAEDRPEHMREQGVTYFTVKTYDDPVALVRDEVLWDGKVLQIIGVRGHSGGAYRTWLLDCEYRPATGGPF